jgi:hypothetical protein
MPVAQTRGHAGKALAIAGVGVAVALGLAFVVATLASRGDVEIRLGDDRFNAGQVDNIAQRIASDGGLPLLYQDLTGGNRNVFVGHLDDNADRGWVAFGAVDPDDPDCAIRLDREAEVLVNDCDETITYPLDGTGLRYYPTSVEDGRLYVDLNELTTTNSTPTTDP